FIVRDEPLVKRLLRVARLADPEPRWRDRFRDADSWRSQEQLLQLADDAFITSPPPSGHQLALLGLLLRNRGGLEQGTHLLGGACRREPDNSRINGGMGAMLLVNGRPLESAAYYRAAIALRPDDAGVPEGLGKALFAVGQVEDALAACRRAAELSADGR